MSRNLSNLYISESFQYLTQVSGSEIQTGLGATVSGSLLITASRADNATSASFADNANTATSASFADVTNTATSSSFAENARSASYAETATSASYATFASGAVDVNAVYTASAEFSEITFEKGDTSTFVVNATPRKVIETVKNVTVSTIAKGTPVYVSGSTGNALNVYPADAGDINRMPAAFILNEQLTAGAEGEAILEGFINGVDTSTFGAGDDVYVAVGGGYTNVKPTGSANYIQKLGNVIKSDVNGSGVITATGYYNDLPNIQSGYAWVGNSDGVATAIPTSSLSTTVDTGSLLITASISDADITFTKGDASTFDITVNNVINSTSASFADNANTATTATTATSSSFADNANTAISASQSDNATSASFADIANTVTGTVTSASYAETASYATDFEVAGTITALSASITYIENVFETSSTIYSSGSNQFGDASNDTQTLYGTVDILTGPLNVSGSSIFHNGITGSLDGTASFADNATSSSFADTSNTAASATSASFADNANSASFADIANNSTSASFADTANTATTATTATNATSASFADTANTATTADSATSASFADNANTATSATSASFADVANTITGTVTSASYAVSSSQAENSTNADSATSASYAVTASYAENAAGADPFPYTGSAIISGSLAIENSVQNVLSLSNYGNTMLGSVSNTITTSNGATIIGNGSQITSGDYTLVVGERNRSKAGVYQFIAGGSDNNLETNSQGYSAIIASYNSNVHNAGGSNLYHAMVLGGNSSTANGNLTSTLSDDSSTVNGVRLSSIATKGCSVSSSIGSVAIATSASTVDNVINSAVIGGVGITATADNTVYVPNLNVSGSATGLVANTADTYATPDIEQVITLTQAEYDGLTPDDNTLYVISGSTPFDSSTYATTGSNTFTGQIVGSVTALTPSSNTASLDCSTGNFFTLTLGDGSDTRLEASNITAGQTINMQVTNGGAGTGTISFGTGILQPSGSLYTGSAAASAVDVVSMISFDGSNLLLNSVKQFV